MCAWINLSTAYTIGNSHAHAVCDAGTRILEDPPFHQPAEENTIPNYMMSYPRWYLSSGLNIFNTGSEQQIKHAIYLHNF